MKKNNKLNGLEKLSKAVEFSEDVIRREKRELIDKIRNCIGDYRSITFSRPERIYCQDFPEACVYAVWVGDDGSICMKTEDGTTSSNFLELEGILELAKAVLEYEEGMKGVQEKEEITIDGLINLLMTKSQKLQDDDYFAFSLNKYGYTIVFKNDIVFGYVLGVPDAGINRSLTFSDMDFEDKNRSLLKTRVETYLREISSYMGEDFDKNKIWLFV